eukprot:NODE_5099_length_427_cov_132.407407_g4430_i0.p1 GENE.NODE_5099_length_427_cov_132.407407_g4430_i0~~NODE_5099_length_427_cov_132.407407_g4430_i0.p1  ORF type:complete len:104 (+),score=21.80 NODE_5099_length_427_cov_132.407407_g4430_i0:57-368(+)
MGHLKLQKKYSRGSGWAGHNPDKFFNWRRPKISYSCDKEFPGAVGGESFCYRTDLRSGCEEGHWHHRGCHQVGWNCKVGEIFLKTTEKKCKKIKGSEWVSSTW